ncbi:MAG: hypothetical protein HQK96_04695 [Nitrospirae bacterium]|nr:hypothetical protein [Nitrospirota bacterium]
MEFFLNELSLECQFNNVSEFYAATNEVFKCRSLINRFGYMLYYKGNLSDKLVCHDTTFRGAIQAHPDRNKKSSILSWITKEGPFWEMEPVQTDYDTFKLHNIDADMMDSSLVEAAKRKYNQIDCNTVSYSPSSYNSTPIEILMEKLSNGLKEQIEVENFWKFTVLSDFLNKKDTDRVQTWDGLIQWAKRNCTHLFFADYILEKLNPCPYSQGIASRVQVLLKILDELNMCMSDKTGNSKKRIDEIFKQFFTGGDEATFTPESFSNKEKHKQKLTFKHPEGGTDLFCHYHGKIKERQFRIHFNWPKQTSDEKLYIVYIGPKITKK